MSLLALKQGLPLIFLFIPDKLALLYFNENCVNGASSDCTGKLYVGVRLLNIALKMLEYVL